MGETQVVLNSKLFNDFLTSTLAEAVKKHGLSEEKANSLSLNAHVVGHYNYGGDSEDTNYNFRLFHNEGKQSVLIATSKNVDIDNSPLSDSVIKKAKKFADAAVGKFVLLAGKD